jgi:hypothetical protein
MNPLGFLAVAEQLFNMFYTLCKRVCEGQAAEISSREHGAPRRLAG